MEIQNISVNSIELNNRLSNTQVEPKVVESIQNKLKQTPEYTPSLSEKAIINAIEEANKKIAGGNTELEFSIHEKTKEILIKIRNKESHEVIREIPSEKILDMVAAMIERAGIFMDEKL